jgi:hypothetical protein
LAGRAGGAGPVHGVGEQRLQLLHEVLHRCRTPPPSRCSSRPDRDLLGADHRR